MNPFKKISYLINVQYLAKISRVSHAKIYFRKNGEVKREMDVKDRTRIINALFEEIEPFFKAMGFSIKITSND